MPGPEIVHDILSLPNGSVHVAWPIPIPIAELDDFNEWMELVRKKIDRISRQLAPATIGQSFTDKPQGAPNA